MSNPSLKTISIEELQVGMFVHGIATKKGNMSLKAQGLVTKPLAIAQLRKKGVKQLVIDLEKSKLESQEKQSVSLVESDVPPGQQTPKMSFGAEIAKANKLHADGKAIQQSLLNAVKQNAPFEEHVPKQFSKEIVNSIDRNADALLCMTKIREKDDYLLEHSLNVAILLAHFGRALGMAREEVDALAYAGFLHDLGKIKVPDEILHKPGRLTDSEMDIMKLHVNYGIEALEEIGIDSDLIRTMSEHHERLDGKGYPFGKTTDDISMQGRMIAIVDVYDALTADRVYKSGMSPQKALQILLKDCPIKYDESLVQKFIKCMGIFPVGSLVLLSNERIGVVLQQNTELPTKPKIRVFYSARHRHYLESKDIDLKLDKTLHIEKAVLANEYNIDTKSFFERSVLHAANE